MKIFTNKGLNIYGKDRLFLYTATEHHFNQFSCPDNFCLNLKLYTSQNKSF